MRDSPSGNKTDTLYVEKLESSNRTFNTTTAGGIVALSEQEQRALREIEQSLLADDPKFGAQVSGSSSFGGGTGTGKITLRGVSLVVVGLVLLVAGVALAQVNLWLIALSVLGFIVMFGAGVWILRTPNDDEPAVRRSSGKVKAPRKDGVSSRMEENFRRRFEDNQ